MVAVGEFIPEIVFFLQELRILYTSVRTVVTVETADGDFLRRTAGEQNGSIFNILLKMGGGDSLPFSPSIFGKLNNKWRKIVRHFRHHGENSVKIDGENGKHCEN